MSVEEALQTRSESKCELCAAEGNLGIYEIPPSSDGSTDSSIYICNTCTEQINDPAISDTDHWRCLSDSMWNTSPAVQVMAWRLLNRLNLEAWSQNLLDMLYLDEDTLKWAQAGINDNNENTARHLDSNGALLKSGDTVTLIKDLNVKGANFTAKRGAAIHSISLVADNPEHIEGKVNGQQIVILTKFVKKSN